MTPFLSAACAYAPAVRIDGFFVSETHFISAKASLIFSLSSSAQLARPVFDSAQSTKLQRRRKWISIAPRASADGILKTPGRPTATTCAWRVASLARCMREANYCHLPEGEGEQRRQQLGLGSLLPNFWRHVHYPGHHCVVERELAVGLNFPINVGLAPTRGKLAPKSSIKRRLTDRGSHAMHSVAFIIDTIR